MGENIAPSKEEMGNGMIWAAIMEDISSVRHLEVIPGAYMLLIQKQGQVGQ